MESIVLEHICRIYVLSCVRMAAMKLAETAASG